MDTRAIDKDVDLATHDFECSREQGAHAVEVCEIAVYRFDRRCGASERDDRVVRVQIGVSWPLDEAYRCACLSQCDCRCRTDAW